jgi:hypothetical protein
VVTGFAFQLPVSGAPGILVERHPATGLSVGDGRGDPPQQAAQRFVALSTIHHITAQTGIIG